MPSTLFILNPAAGHGCAAGVWEAFRGDAERLLPGAVCVRTSGPAHATAIARDAVTGGAERIIAVGGDGTFSEVLEGVMRAPAELRRTVALAALPAGSAATWQHLYRRAAAAGTLRPQRGG